MHVCNYIEIRTLCTLPDFPEQKAWIEYYNCMEIKTKSNYDNNYLPTDKKIEVASASVATGFIGWVNLSVERMVRRWKKHRHNHGLLITVQDQDLIPWDGDKLFVTMDCSSGNNSAYTASRFMLLQPFIIFTFINMLVEPSLHLPYPHYTCHTVTTPATPTLHLPHPHYTYHTIHNMILTSKYHNTKQHKTIQHNTAEHNTI